MVKIYLKSQNLDQFTYFVYQDLGLIGDRLADEFWASIYYLSQIVFIFLLLTCNKNTTFATNTLYCIVLCDNRLINIQITTPI